MRLCLRITLWEQCGQISLAFWVVCCVLVVVCAADPVNEDDEFAVRELACASCCCCCCCCCEWISADICSSGSSWMVKAWCGILNRDGRWEMGDDS